MTAVLAHISVLNAPQGIWPMSAAVAIRVDQMRNAHHPDLWVNDATLAGSLLDSSGNSEAVVNFTYLSGSNGRYEGTLDCSGLTEGAWYDLVITASGTADGTWRINNRRAAKPAVA